MPVVVTNPAAIRPMAHRLGEPGEALGGSRANSPTSPERYALRDDSNGQRELKSLPT